MRVFVSMAIALLVAGLAAAADWVSAPGGGDGGKQVSYDSSQGCPAFEKVCDLPAIERERESISPNHGSPFCLATLCRREIICPVAQQAGVEKNAPSHAPAPVLKPALSASEPTELTPFPAVVVGAYVK